MARNISIREAYRRLLPYLIRQKRKAALIVLLGTVAALGSKINLVLVHPLGNLLLEGEVAPEVKPDAPEFTSLESFSRDTIAPLLQGWDFFGLGESVSAVIIVLVIMLTSAVVFSLIQFVFLRLARMLGVWMVTDLRQDLAEHILKLGMRYHSGRRLGDLLSRLTADVGTSLRMLMLIVEEMIQEPVNIISSLALAYLASPSLTLAVVVVIPLGLGVCYTALRG